MNNNISYETNKKEYPNINNESKNTFKYEDWQLDVVRKYFLNGVIPKSSENIDVYLVNTNINSIIKDLLGVIVARLNHGQSIHKFITWLMQEEKNPFIEDIIYSKSDEVIENSVSKEKNEEINFKIDGTERNKTKIIIFPKEEENDQLRDETGRNVYDILTYKEKIDFLIKHPEYTLENLPRGFFKNLELQRLNIDFPNGLPSKSINLELIHDSKDYDKSIYEKIVNDSDLIERTLKELEESNLDSNNNYIKK